MSKNGYEVDYKYDWDFVWGLLHDFYLIISSINTKSLNDEDF